MVNLFKDGFIQSNNIFFDFVFTCIIYIYNDVLIMFKFTCNNFVFEIKK